MKRAGDYTDYLVWKQRTTAKDAFGQDVETFVDNGRLWASVVPDSGRREDDYGAEQTGQNGTIRIRNYPDVSALDRFYRPEWDQTWVITSIYYGDNETVCDCHTFDGPVI